jgi:3'-phosphoadenosine 5'-phosphosulfate sulfotransferase (PAPS reductase)/FAD synthetase
MTVSRWDTKERVSPGKLAEAHNTLEQLLEYAKRPVLAYSGGKDGLVVAHMARALGIKTGVCEQSFYFTEQKADIRRQANALGMNVIYRDHIDMPWLAKRPNLVFNHDSATRSKFYFARQQQSVTTYAEAHGHDAIVTGRKRGGNSVKAPLYRKRNGLWMCHPLASWDDGDVWTYLRDASIAVPWVYQTPFGQSEGNSCWPMLREFKSLDQNYRVIHRIEPALVTAAAAAGIASAAAFLRGL